MRQISPNLALVTRVVVTLSRRLDSLTHAFQTMHDSSQHIRDLEKEATDRRILNEDWNDTLEVVRKLEGFDGFLLPKSISQLRNASSNGSVVFLNAADSGCDALIVTQDEVKHIPLPDISMEMTQFLGDTVVFRSNRHWV